MTVWGLQTIIESTLVFNVRHKELISDNFWLILMESLGTESQANRDLHRNAYDIRKQQKID